MIVTKELPDGLFEHRCDCCQDYRKVKFPKLVFRCKCEPGKECIKAGGPSLVRKLKNYAKATVQHKKAGSPECTDEQVAERFAICKACRLFDKIDEENGKCTHPSCGCPLKAVGVKGRNKLRYADQQCPIYNPDPDPKKREGWPRLDLLPIVEKSKPEKPMGTLKSKLVIEAPTNMRIVTLLFGPSKDYKRCAEVLKYTAMKYCPNWAFELQHHDFNSFAKEHNFPLNRPGHNLNNAIKTKMFRMIVEEADDGELLCLIDSDTFITGCFDEIQEIDFDLAVTNKEGKQQKAPINTGVVFVRVSEKTKQWFREWDDVVQDLLAHPTKLQPLKRIYLGINQSGLSVMMKKEHDLNIVELPGSVWNCTTVFWPSFSEKTKVVHILGQLRMGIFKNHHLTNSATSKLKKLWHSLRREAGVQ